jgi:hypothetical protein
MEYYCKKCGAEYGSPRNAFDLIDRCPSCGAQGAIRPIPAWETPEHFEKRIGSPYRDDGLVWVKGLSDWSHYLYSE